MVKNSMDIIVAKNLAAAYKTNTVWSKANFRVQRGEFIGVLGPNGAGKTTLFRLLLGLEKPTEGKLEIFGEKPSRGNPRIGYIPQRRPIDDQFNLEALELVRLGIKGTNWGFALPAGAHSERLKALDALKSVDAEDLAARPLGQLSGGELQRVFLAQALVGKPDLLLLDEPLANLDIRREAELIRLVSEISKNYKVAVLLIAHDINPLLPVVDRLIYAVNGKIATGKSHEIVNTKTLSKLYGAQVEVLQGTSGRLAVLGTEEAAHHV